MKHKITLYTLIALLSITTLGCGDKLTSTLEKKVDTAKSELNEANQKQIKAALSLYLLDHSVYPSTEEGLKALVGEKYLLTPEIIKPFSYELKADGSYTLKSL